MVRRHIERPAQVEDVIEQANLAMESRGTTARQLWDREDVTRRDRLDYKQVAHMLKKAAPGITSQQIRTLVHKCYINDLDNAGELTYLQFQQVGVGSWKKRCLLGLGVLTCSF